MAKNSGFGVEARKAADKISVLCDTHARAVHYPKDGWIIMADRTHGTESISVGQGEQKLTFPVVELPAHVAG